MQTNEAYVEAGSLVRDMDQATQRVGLATTLGGCATVGVAGLTLGGGEGILMSRFGAACDNLWSAQMVLVDGRQVEVSHDSNPDLFWAIRGGGANFGVVTATRILASSTHQRACGCADLSRRSHSGAILRFCQVLRIGFR